MDDTAQNVVMQHWQQRRLRVSFKCFSPANTGLDKGSEYPEMGSMFKASFLKSALHFFTEKSIELAELCPEDTSLWIR